VVPEVHGHLRVANIFNFRRALERSALQSVGNLVSVDNRKLRHQIGMLVEPDSAGNRRARGVRGAGPGNFPTVIVREQAVNGIVGGTGTQEIFQPAAISTSGESSNVLKGLAAAKAKCSVTVALTGRDGSLLQEVSRCRLCIPADATPRIQAGHILVGHILSQLTEMELFGR
jgi:hypothetical protein